MKIAFVTSHPIQYQVPIFRHLAAREDLRFVAMFAMVPDASRQGVGFGIDFEWDIPLLEGYDYEVLQNVSKCPSVVNFSGCDTPRIAQTLLDQQIDAVVVNGWVVKSCLQTLRACRRNKLPCIVRGESNHLRPRPWWKRLAQRKLVRQFDAYLSIGNANREFYQSYGVTDHSLFDARYCVENERFFEASASLRGQRTELRRSWGVPPGATCFLFCGKFEAKKHPIELLHSFREAYLSNHSDRPIYLLMVGDGELRSECEQIVKRYRLPVTFTGFLNQSEIVASYIASDCLVLPSDHGETWGLVVNEAMACGMPAIVSSQVGCQSDLVRDHETGFVFDFGDWPMLTRVILEAASDRSRLRQLGQAAQTLIGDYSPSSAADGIVSAARWALSHGSTN
ncbi:glycosyltransferase family 4 protein [Roseiconus lacunae]|uniref:glycosyltransferase family 4 protein n=1 Tax=Roseiconus lacunae TaxID=2605694 RepID=UPI003085CC3F|nr:glycosyltransferase family 4 protein [Stieleria sp. HD01]